MKLFELYERRPLREDKTLTASIKLCESVINLLESDAFVTEAPVKDPNALAVKKVATELFGAPYSSARIGGGKVHRISFTIGNHLRKHYRYVPMHSVAPDDKEMLVQLKSRFFKACEQAGIDMSLVDIKFHIGAGMYASVRTKIEEAVAENFEYEPDPAFAGVKGVTRDTGAGEQDRKAAEQKQQHAKVNQTWQKLVGNLGKLDFAGAEKLKVNLKKLAGVAKKNGIQLTPSPEDVLG